jgi:hypothetical protein
LERLFRFTSALLNPINKPSPTDVSLERPLPVSSVSLLEIIRYPSTDVRLASPSNDNKS